MPYLVLQSFFINFNQLAWDLWLCSLLRFFVLFISGESSAAADLVKEKNIHIMGDLTKSTQKKNLLKDSEEVLKTQDTNNGIK